MAAAKTALIIGSTGLVGEECVKVLLSTDLYASVIALSRKKIEVDAKWSSKFKNLVVDFDKLDDYRNELKADDIFCTMGTTIGKAGSQEAFRKVDYEIPLQLANIALKNGAKKFILVSALGADAQSKIFYSRVKGELEEALKALKYASLIIFRPSLLLGDRKEKRFGESIGQFVAEKGSFLFSGPLKKYRGTPVNLLAATMVKLANENLSGTRIIENEEIFELAEK